MERARSELIQRARNRSRLAADARRVLFLVHELTARYHAPARLKRHFIVVAEVV